MSGFLLKKKIFLFLVFFPLALFADDWTLAGTAFTWNQKNVPAAASHIGTLLPKLILEQITENGSRTVSSEEKKSRLLKTFQTERIDLFLKLSREEKAKDALLFTKTKPRELQKALAEQQKKIEEIQKQIDENLLAASSIQIEEGGFSDSERIVLYKKDAGALFSPSEQALNEGIDSLTYENEVLKASINGLLTGKITFLGDYISVQVELYQFPGGKLQDSVIEVGNSSDLMNIARNIAQNLTPKLTNSLPVEIDFEFEGVENPDLLNVSVDGVFVTNKEKIVVDAGIHTVTISSEKYDTQTISYSFSGEEKFTVRTKLVPKIKGNLDISLKKMISGYFYFKGESGIPVNDENLSAKTSINGKTVLGFFENEAGESAFVLIPENNARDGNCLTVNAVPFDRAKHIDRQRRRMYTAYTALICTLPATFFCIGEANAYIGAYNLNLGISRDEALRKQTNSYIAGSVSGVAGAWFVFEMVRYLLAANGVLPAEAKIKK